MSRVFRLHSTLEVPLETLHDYFDADPTYPEGVDDVAVERRKNTLLLSAEADDESLGKYTPTAQLKATVSEIRVPDEDAEPEPDDTAPGWGQAMEEEEQPTKLVNMAGFKGNRESVLQNTALQYEMFLVLVDLAAHAERGELTAIHEEDGELSATRIVEGERRPAQIEVVDDPSASLSSGVDWRNNQYIN
jgi:hypothetical protein